MFSIVYAASQNVASTAPVSPINPFVAYVLSPAIVFSVLLFIAAKIFNLGEMKEKIFKSAESISNLDSDVKKLLRHSEIMKTHLVTTSGLDAQLFSSASPLQLLDKGKNLLEDSGFKSVYEGNKSLFIDEFKKYKTATLAEIDDASYKVLDALITKHSLMDTKDVAFRNGVSPEVLLKVLSIYLRDEVSSTLLTSKAQ